MNATGSRAHRAAGARAKLARLAGRTGAARTAAIATLVVFAGVPAVALARFSSSPTAAATISSGPLAPTEASDKCNGAKTVVSWSAPAGFAPDSYTVWVAYNGKEPYAEAATVSGTHTSVELSLGNSNYAPALTASYGSWKSPLSAPAGKLKCG
jgi:hypothetical protein